MKGKEPCEQRWLSKTQKGFESQRSKRRESMANRHNLSSSCLKQHSPEEGTPELKQTEIVDLTRSLGGSAEPPKPRQEERTTEEEKMNCWNKTEVEQKLRVQILEDGIDIEKTSPNMGLFITQKNKRMVKC